MRPFYFSIVFLFLGISCAPLQTEDHLSLSSLQGGFTAYSFGIESLMRNSFAPYKENVNSTFTNYLSNVLYENSSCYCGGSDLCTRGCQQGSNALPLLNCRGRKNKKTPTNYCMRHVNGALMNTIDNFLSPYCKTLRVQEINFLESEQCGKNFDWTNVENINICTNSFVFPSAICALNLDGQSEWNKWGPTVYNAQTIPSKAVRTDCRSWGKYNQILASIPIKRGNGPVTRIPLFKKIPLEYIEREGGEMDPASIPVGSILVMKSSNPNGHTEIKTNKKECGDNKDETCFCSDFCINRTGDNSFEEKGLEIQAIFTWNPKALEQLYYWNPGMLEI